MSEARRLAGIRRAQAARAAQNNERVLAAAAGPGTQLEQAARAGLSITQFKRVLQRARRAQTDNIGRTPNEQ